MTTRAKMGVFGGTFDPPHIGHLILASEAAEQLSLARVLWVLTRFPPHKREKIIAPVDIRLKLVQAALRGNPLFQLSRVEVDRSPPHYAVETIRILKDENPDMDLIYLMGGDSLRELPTWHTPLLFLEACAAVGVMRRPGSAVDIQALEAQLPGVKEKILWIEAPLVEISSSLIREKINRKSTCQYYIPASVAKIVRKYHLYQD